MIKWVFALMILVLIGAGAGLWSLSGHSVLKFDPVPAAVGNATTVRARISNPHGARRVTAWIDQGGTTMPVLDRPLAAPNRLWFWKLSLPPQAIEFQAGKKNAPQLKEGPATLVLETESNDLLGQTDRVSVGVTVTLRPPMVSADGFQHYINQGGAELALFTPSGSWTEAGVRVGDRTFRSFPVPGDPQQRMAFFAYAWDSPPGTAPAVYVRNAAGQEIRGRFRFKIFPKKYRVRDFAIDDAFLQKVVPQIDASGSGPLIDQFLKINRETRAANNKTLADLRLKTDEKFLWSQPFLQLSNSKVESAFADIRGYIYKGEKLDQQVHLGFDLATVAHGPVLAANSGKVVWAAPLGIYGNCIVIDHGFAVQSIYGHLSQLHVQEGQNVERGQEIGRSGSTGLAGGDHLHYSMQVDGVQVNPLEWWDGHWIDDHIRKRVPLP